MSTEAAAASILVTRIPMGDALEEGRAPSHDGEYLALYHRDGIPTEWICEGNGGVTATHHYTHTDVEPSNEAEELDQRIAVALQEGNSDPMTGCGNEARDLMLKWGWVNDSQFDGGSFMGADRS